MGTPWLELNLVGPVDVLEALLHEGASRAMTDRALDLAEESFGERLLEAIHLDHRHRVYLPESEVGDLLARLRLFPALRLVGRRTDLRGRFAFRAETPSREAAAKIREVLHAPPPEGLTLRLLAEGEEIDPQSQGPHLYDRAAHAFVYTMRGEAEGSVPGIFELHRRIVDLEFVHAERLRVAGDWIEA